MKVDDALNQDGHNCNHKLIDFNIDDGREGYNTHLAMIPNNVISDSRFQNYNKFSYKNVKRSKNNPGSTLTKILNTKKRTKLGFISNQRMRSDRKLQYLDSNPYARGSSNKRAYYSNSAVEQNDDSTTSNIGKYKYSIEFLI